MTALSEVTLERHLSAEAHVVYPHLIADCCEVCDRARLSCPPQVPRVIGFGSDGWVTGYYLCERGHWWECSWSKAVLEGDVLLP